MYLGGRDPDIAQIIKEETILRKQHVTQLRALEKQDIRSLLAICECRRHAAVLMSLIQTRD